MRIPPPVSRYLTGSSPSHSGTGKLGSHFKGIDQDLMVTILETSKIMTKGKPNKQALRLEYIDVCGSNLLWNLGKIETLLKKAGMRPERIPANQELPDVGEEFMTSLTEIGSFFNVGGAAVGRWLRDLGHRNEKGVPEKKLLRSGKAEKVDFKSGGKSRTFYKWNLLWALRELQGAGHLFEFDAEKSLEAKGQSSAVQVTTREDRAKEFAEEFYELYKEPKTRHRAKDVVRRIPPRTMILVEKYLNKHEGWLSSGEYLQGP